MKAQQQSKRKAKEAKKKPQHKLADLPAKKDVRGGEIVITSTTSSSSSGGLPK